MKRKIREEIWMCPSVDMHYDAKGESIVTEIELPGVRKSDIKLETGQDGFCIEAKRSDMRFDSCYRFWDRVDANNVQAQFSNGLLKMSAPIERSALHAKRVAIH